jgi:uncharacterized membrane protein SpoIIM required for sporulation
VIIDLRKFTELEQPYWRELEDILKKLEDDPSLKLTLAQLQRLHYLYERASAGLGKLMTFAVAPDTRAYLEALVARAYAEVHETRGKKRGVEWIAWFLKTFPRTFRARSNAFILASAIKFAGLVIGAMLLVAFPEHRAVLLPFGHDRISPSQRVAREQRNPGRIAGSETEFSAQLMTHNTRVSMLSMSLGMTYGVGTVIVMFYNGIGLGAVAWDYILDGQTRFLLGWLLPHGVIEIPAILMSGQAGLVLASALIGWGRRATLRQRLREVSNDVLTLIGGVAVLLVWAGIVEGFLSQRHEPEIPYTVKIVFGLIELTALCYFLARSGRAPEET